MKKYITPDVEVIRFTIADIVTSSGNDELPMLPINAEDTLQIIEID